MNTLEYIGIHTDRRSKIDDYVLDCLTDYIGAVAERIDQPVTRIKLAAALGTDRQRISRICKTLEITDIFD